jgi:hypothetical protein
VVKWFIVYWLSISLLTALRRQSGEYANPVRARGLSLPDHPLRIGRPNRASKTGSTILGAQSANVQAAAIYSVMFGATQCGASTDVENRKPEFGSHGIHFQSQKFPTAGLRVAVWLG